MTLFLATRITAFVWLAWLVYWMIAASRAKRTRVRDTPSAMLMARVFMLLAAVTYLLRFRWFGPLQHRLFLPTLAILWISLALTFAGLAFSVWARVVIAGNWSSTIELKQGHELIRSGPYARIRHPIYSGVMFAGIGAVLLRPTGTSILAFALLGIGFWAKARREEAILATQFGPALETYRRETGMFLPRIGQPDALRLPRHRPE